MFGNGTYLAHFVKLQQRTTDATGENRRFVKKVVLAIGTTLNCAFAFADFGLARSAGEMVGEFGDLGAMRAFAVIAG